MITFWIALLLDSSRFADCITGQVMLAGHSRKYQGQVIVCVNNAWGTVCNEHWDHEEGNLICRQLGFQPFGIIHV